MYITIVWKAFLLCYSLTMNCNNLITFLPYFNLSQDIEIDARKCRENHKKMEIIPINVAKLYQKEEIIKE